MVRVAVWCGRHILLLRGFRRTQASECLAPVLRLVDERFEACGEELDIRQRQRERTHEGISMCFRVLAERRALRPRSRKLACSIIAPNAPFASGGGCPISAQANRLCD